jgi:hypothetical protein
MNSALAILAIPPVVAEPSGPWPDLVHGGFAASFAETDSAPEMPSMPADPAFAPQVVPVPWVVPQVAVPEDAVDLATGFAVQGPRERAVTAPDRAEAGSDGNDPGIDGTFGPSATTEADGPSPFPVVVMPDAAPDMPRTRQDGPQPQSGLHPPVSADLPRNAPLRMPDMPREPDNPALPEGQRNRAEPALARATGATALRSDGGTDRPSGVIDHMLATEGDVAAGGHVIRPSADKPVHDLVGKHSQGTDARSVPIAAASWVVSQAPDQSNPSGLLRAAEGRTAAPSSASVPDGLNPDLPAETALVPAHAPRIASPVTAWERIFVNLTLPQSADKPEPAGMVDEAPVVSGPAMPSADGLPSPSAALIVLPGDSPPEPDLAAPAGRDHLRDRVATAALPTLPALPEAGRPTVPMGQTAVEPAPVLLLTGWEEGPSDPRAEAEDAVASPASPSLGPVSATRGGGAGQVILSIPQVAAQLTGVLVARADGATEVALAPEELGRVRLRLEPDTTNPDRMVILVSVERPETLDLFRRHAGELAEAIRAAGYSGADIGFGQGSTGQDREKPNASGEAPWVPASEDPVQMLSAPRPVVAGASLDLRL